ncbi:MAG: radical SAM protein [Leptospirales bacterium]
MISDDIDYYKRSRDYMKASEMPQRFNTPVVKGCPDDCGLCEDHEQHSCLSILEITDNCDLACPVCYAQSKKGRAHRSLKDINFMLDCIVENEGTPDVVQISGGEPTTHPQFFEVLEAARKRPIRHLMVNTNGVRLAEEEGFAEKLAEYMPGFELYLQFDSFSPKALKTLRGKDLRATREKALEKINKLNLSTTLVVTLAKGVNDHEIGEILDFATKQPAVRGVNFQPMQVAGRVEGTGIENSSLTLSEVRNRILEQSNLLQADDLIPVPCHPDALCMGYAIKMGEEIFPLTRYANPEELLKGSRNTIVFEKDTEVKKNLIKLFSTGCSPLESAGRIKDLLCCLPKVEAPGLSYDNIFRVLITKFMDANDFDVRSVKKSCIHIVHPDGRLIPFETMNLFYRDSIGGSE